MHHNYRVIRLSKSLLRVSKTRYPSFLFGKVRGEDRLPAFIYHDIDSDSFEQDLKFLIDNEYQSLSTREYVRQKENGLTSHSVLITFDDARRNFFEKAFPLIKKYDVHVTLFVPTCWIHPFDSSPDSFFDPSIPPRIFMTWDELRICQESGLVDIQSHAHRHALVFTSPRVMGFCSPGLLEKCDIYDWPMQRVNGRNYLGPPPLGTPIFQSEPLLSASYHMLIDGSITEQCQEYIIKNGGEGFFSDPRWPRTLHAKLKELISLDNRSILKNENIYPLMMDEFSQSESLFQKNLGYKPEYFAYPWLLGSELSLQCAIKKDIKAAFGVGVDYRRVRRIKEPISIFGRTKSDWIRFLPGKGRKTLREVVPGKFKKFLRSQHLAH